MNEWTDKAATASALKFLIASKVQERSIISIEYVYKLA